MKLPAGKKAILVLGLPLGLAAAGGLAFMQLSAPPPVPVEVPEPAEGQHGVLLALEERVINLQQAGLYRYAKIGVTVEIRPESASFYELAGEARAHAEEEAVLHHEASVPLLLDALGGVVSAKDSKTLTAPEGRAELKTEVLEAFRHVLGEHEVLDVYFTDLVMQ
jgi:flagellar basal body-associated protein FliL